MKANSFNTPLQLVIAKWSTSLIFLILVRRSGVYIVISSIFEFFWGVSPQYTGQIVISAPVKFPCRKVRQIIGELSTWFMWQYHTVSLTDKVHNSNWAYFKVSMISSTSVLDAGVNVTMATSKRPPLTLLHNFKSSFSEFLTNLYYMEWSHSLPLSPRHTIHYFGSYDQPYPLYPSG